MLDFVVEVLEKYGLSDRLDAKQVLLKMGGRRPGKHCVGKGGGKGSYIAAEKKCAGHKTAFGELTEAGKTSARELADKVRKRKGMDHFDPIVRKAQRENRAMEKSGPSVGSDPWFNSLSRADRSAHHETVKKWWEGMDQTARKAALKDIGEKDAKISNFGNGMIKRSEASYSQLKMVGNRLSAKYAVDNVAKVAIEPTQQSTGDRYAGMTTKERVAQSLNDQNAKIAEIKARQKAQKEKPLSGYEKDVAKTYEKTRKIEEGVQSGKVGAEEYLRSRGMDDSEMALFRDAGALDPSYKNYYPNDKEGTIKATAWAKRDYKRFQLLKRGFVKPADNIATEVDRKTLQRAIKGNKPDRRDSQLERIDTMDFDFVVATLEKYGLSDRFDAGQICGEGWTGVKGQCERENKIIRNKDGRRRYSNKVAMGRLLFPDIALAHDIIKRRKPDLLAGVKTDSAQQLGDRFDAKKVLLKMGGRRPGKRCKKGWIAAEKQCSDHKTKEGKLTAEGKQSARELASRVRDRKGMQDKRGVTLARMSLEKFMEPIKGAATEKQLAPGFRKMHKEERSELNKRRINGGRSAFVDKGQDVDTLKKQLVGLDDRIESAQKTGTARKTAATKARNQAITPNQLNSGDRKQAVAYNQQGAERAKSEGRSGDASAWDKQVKSARIANVRSSQRQKSTSQGEMFGIEETTDLPLFRKRKDSHRRFDRAIAGGKATPKSTRRKHNCTSKSQQCGSVCISLKKECRDGAVGGAQDRLRKLKKSGADDLQVQRAKQSIKDRTVGKRNEINDKRIGSLRNRVKNATMSGVGKSEGLAELDPNSIEVDPKRFQYKIIGEHTSTGSVGSLSGVRKYDPNLAGILQVWKDPKDGKTYVVNGHNRLDLGKKLGAESVAVRYLKAPDAKTARSIGALTNIAEGRGDALDAAKFFRDTGISKEDLNAKGIPMREKIATEGLALSRLDDSLFRRTIDGDIPMARAAIVGGSGLDDAQQRDLMKLVDKQGKSKNLTDGAIAEMVDIAKSSQTRQESTMSLFGEESVTKSNMIEKAKLQASIKQRLSREKNLFGTVSRGRAASELARGGNTIDREKSGEISDQANQSLKTFDQMKNLSGPMSDAINRAASRMADGESQKSVEKDLYAEITAIDIFGGTKRRAA